HAARETRLTNSRRCSGSAASTMSRRCLSRWLGPVFCFFAAHHVLENAMKRSVRRTACIAAAMLGLLSCDRSPLSPPASDFDVAASTGKCWTTKAELATGRNQLGVGAVNGIVYALGGHGRNFAVDTVEAYDPAT